MNIELQPKKKPLFSLRFSIVLSFLLGLPFVMRTIIPSFEPYPAALLPAGSSKIDLSQEDISFSKIKIMGKNQDGEWIELDAQSFLSPIPPHFLYVVVENEFGLGDGTRKELKSRVFDLSVPKRQFSPEQIEETKGWIRTKLAEAGLEENELRIVEVDNRLDLTTKYIDGEEIKDERIIDLR